MKYRPGLRSDLCFHPMRHHGNLNQKDADNASLPSRPSPGVPSRIPPPLPGTSHGLPCGRREGGRDGLGKRHNYDGESHCARPWRVIYEGPLPKNKSSSLEQRVSAVAGRCVCRPPPRPPLNPNPFPLMSVCLR